MGEIATSLGKALCTVVTVGGGSVHCYNTTAMQTVGNGFVLAVILITVGYRAMSRL